MCEIRGITAVLLTASKHFNVSLHLDVLGISLTQTWCDDRYYCTLQSDTSQTDHDLDSKSQECKKTKPSEPIISQSFELI